MCPEGAQDELNVSDVFPKVIKLSSEASECKPLPQALFAAAAAAELWRARRQGIPRGQPLVAAAAPAAAAAGAQPAVRRSAAVSAHAPGARGLHSSTFQLNF